ncbi:hypothetical protein [Paenibacillus sp. FSL R5-0914]|uniref:hypothetical protein n=1 Tax=Paenibacillus sp. FSL R5-0914 TaxID=2921665 RepID=UPI0030FA292C
MDKENQVLEKSKTVYEIGDIITTKLYKVSPEQKEELNRLPTERSEKLREE